MAPTGTICKSMPDQRKLAQGDILAIRFHCCPILRHPPLGNLTSNLQLLLQLSLRAAHCTPVPPERSRPSRLQLEKCLLTSRRTGTPPDLRNRIHFMHVLNRPGFALRSSFNRQSANPWGYRSPRFRNPDLLDDPQPISWGTASTIPQWDGFGRPRS